MMNALVALDSTSCSGKMFDRFADAIRFFQQVGILPPQVSIVSIYHASLTPLPLEYYAKEKGRLMKEADFTIKLAAQDRFDFDSVKILHSDSTSIEDQVSQISKYSKRRQADLLVVGGNDRSGFANWILGSFSETAALTASVPVLIIKRSMQSFSLSKKPRFVIAVDVAALPDKKTVNWIANLAKDSNAFLELVYVVPRHRFFLDSLQQRKNQSDVRKALKDQCSRFSRMGVRSKYNILDEDKSVGHTVAKFADDVGAWLTITTAARRTRARKVLLGSRARRLLAISKRPFLSVRLD